MVVFKPLSFQVICYAVKVTRYRVHLPIDDVLFSFSEIHKIMVCLVIDCDVDWMPHRITLT